MLENYQKITNTDVQNKVVILEINGPG